MRKNKLIKISECRDLRIDDLKDASPQEIEELRRHYLKQNKALVKRIEKEYRRCKLQQIRVNDDFLSVNTRIRAKFRHT